MMWISNFVEWCPSGTSGPRGFGVEVRSGRGGVVGGVDPLFGELLSPIRIDFPRRCESGV